MSLEEELNKVITRTIDEFCEFVRNHFTLHESEEKCASTLMVALVNFANGKHPMVLRIIAVLKIKVINMLEPHRDAESQQRIATLWQEKLES